MIILNEICQNTYNYFNRKIFTLHLTLLAHRQRKQNGKQLEVLVFQFFLCVIFPISDGNRLKNRLDVA